MDQAKKKIRAKTLQAGVTLLLAILVLSSVMAVSVSLATIMFVEVRSSGDLLRTETAYYGADGAIEEAIYKVKRSVPSSGCDTSLPNCYSSGVGSVSLNNVPPAENNLTDPIVQDAVPSGALDSYGNFPSSAKRYTFYDPACPSPNPSNSTSSQCRAGGSGYGRITLTYLNSGSYDHIKVYLCQFDPTFSINLTGGQLDSNQYGSVPCSQPNFYSSPNYWLVQGFDFYPGISNSYCSSYSNSCTWIVDSNKQQELIIFDPVSGSTLTPYIQLQAYDAGGVAKGVPYFQEKAVDINAQTAGINRKVRVIVPTGNGSVVSSGAVNCSAAGTNTFNACYYNDMTLSNEVLNRTDAYPLTFNWGGGSPDPSVPVDNFSASWVGSFSFSGGSYTFTTVSDDGVRLYIDGTKVIDNWTDHGPTPNTYTTSLNGTHVVRMEYYENGGGAVAQLSWAPVDTVWAEDSLPSGASPASDGGDSWTWVGSSPAPYSGSLASQSSISAVEHQHYFTSASPAFTINTGETLVAYVYLDPSNPPSQIELQWNSNEQGWNHRAFWNNSGTDQIGWGTQGTQSLKYIGSLPVTGQWVRLAVPASLVSLEGLHVNGVALTLYGGRATWDHIGESP